MMRLPSFRFHRPKTLAEAARLLAAAPQTTRLVAGGTDLWPNLKRRHQQAEDVVSLALVRELHGVERKGDGTFVLGAMTTLAELGEDRAIAAEHPALSRAIRSISSPVLRNMGTLGGNLCLDTRCTYYNQNEEWRRAIGYCKKEVGETCWVAPGSPRCWAISASDSAPMLCALGASVRLVSAAGERTIPLTSLYEDDGIAYLTKRPDEILTQVVVPPAQGVRSSFWKLRRRGSIDFGVLSVAGAVALDAERRVRAAQLFLGCVASFPTPCVEAMASLVGAPLDEERIARAAALARKAASPLSNTDFLPQWRSKMVEPYTAAVLREIAGLPQQRLAPAHAF